MYIDICASPMPALFAHKPSYKMNIVEKSMYVRGKSLETKIVTASYFV